jgi:hypothetical protein
MNSPRFLLWLAVPATLAVAIGGCQLISDRLTRYRMLDQKAMDDPIQAVGGDGVLFVPDGKTTRFSRQQLARTSLDQLVNYYSPIFVQQRVNTKALKYPYPPEFDMIGEARLRLDEKGKFQAYVAGLPKVYVLVKKVPIEGHDHVQITYTAWYPAHPRLKLLDLEEAEIDSCVLRVTLDSQNCPVFYETIAACGCFHKVFVERWVEDAARQHYGPPEKDKKYCVERTVKRTISWEVAGIVDEPRDEPGRPVVFLKAGEHKVIGLGSSMRLRTPPQAESHPYRIVSYADLYAVAVDGTTEKGPFFDLGNGGKVFGAERKERFLLWVAGVDSAGQPRADDQIKIHFDQTVWGNPAIYGRYLRLPPGML